MKLYWGILEGVVYFLVFLTVFIASLYVPTDPDLGWHLKYGEYFFKHGQILRENTFSTEMADFKWANGQWGTDVLTYASYHTGGFLGLTILSAFIVTLTFYFFSKAGRLRLSEMVLLFPVFIYLENPVNSVSFRGQQISLMITGILCYLLSRYPEKRKILYFLPVLFLLWANIHEQFLLGLAILGVWMGVTVGVNMTDRTNKTYKTNRTYMIVIYLLCVGVTFINPYGAGVHLDAIAHFGNPLLKDVAEYLPFETLSFNWWAQVLVGVMVVMSLVFLYFRGQITDSLPLMTAALLFFVLSFGVRRYAWTAYYLILPILVPMTQFLVPNQRRNRLYYSLVISVIFLVIIIMIKWPLNTYSSANWVAYCKSGNTMCSPDSAEFMVKQNTGNLYSLYGWGGWLIWNYPELKPNIDGRMHVWEEDGKSAFREYYAYEQNTEDIDNSKYSIVYMSPGKPVYKRMEELAAEGKWSKIYEDKLAGIFVRKKI